ncbi:MAG: arsenate reductase ArsC [Pseudomonadota bacterium]
MAKRSIMLPGSVLFACSENALRSPIAEALLKHHHSTRIFVQSVGVRAGELDGFACAVMQEIGLDISKHTPKSFEELTDNYFDVVISLSPEAQHRSVELTRNAPIELEYWALPDPSAIEAPRTQRLEAYRELRDGLHTKIRDRFPMPGIAAR